MTKINELGSAAFRPGGNHINLGKHLSGHNLGGPSTSADSWFSRHSQQLYPQEPDYDEEEEFDMDEILEYRVYREEKFALIETLNNLNEKSERELKQTDKTLSTAAYAARKGMDTAVSRGVKKFVKSDVVKKTAKDLVKSGVHSSEKEAIKALAASERQAIKAGLGSMKPSFLSRIPGLGKVAGMALPVFDIAVGTAFLLSCAKQINEFNKKFNKVTNLQVGSELPNYMIDATDREFDEFLEYLSKLAQVNEKEMKVLLKDFNSILLTLKDLVMTICVAAAPYVTAGAGSAIPVLGTIAGYLGGKFTGIATAMAIHAIPAERLLFDITSEISDGMMSAIKMFDSHEELSETKSKIERDSLAWCFFSSPIQTFARLGKVYELLGSNSKSNLNKAINVAKFVTENSLYDFTYDDDYRLIEDYASQANAMNKKLVDAARNRKNLPNVKLDDYLEDNLDEFSGAAAAGGGPAVPVGYTAKGKPETPTQRRKRQEFNRKKSFPYRG